MFYLLFNTDLPSYWDRTTLWAVQTVLSSSVAAEPGKHRRMRSADQLQRALTDTFNAMIQMPEFTRFFPSPSSLTDAQMHLEKFLTHSANMLFQNIKRAQSLDPLPDVVALQCSLNEDSQFRSYIENIGKLAD